MARIAKVSRSGRTGRAAAQTTYEGTMSSYGPTRGESVGEPVPPYAYSSAQQAKAYNKMKAHAQKIKEILGDE